MMLNRYFLAAAVAVVCVFASYIFFFLPIYGFDLSADRAVWGQFGDYIGGSLNPILSFISLILLIKSLSLQNDANIDLRNQLADSRKTENFRFFNSLFFNMIDSQKNLFENFRIQFVQGGNIIERMRVLAILHIEEEIEILRNSNAKDEQIKDFLEDLDSEDQIFGILRAFYIAVKIIFEKLNEENGFSKEDRMNQLLTLINFSDFAHLRLILIGMQFFEYKSSRYLRENELFLEALGEVKLTYGKY